MSALRHKHFFSALPVHWGPYAERGDEHYHSCIEEGKGDERCDRILVGPGRYCDGKPETHYGETMSAPEPLSAEERAAIFGHPMRGLWAASRAETVARYEATVQAAEHRAEQAEAERDALREEVRLRTPCSCTWIGGSDQPPRRVTTCARCRALGEEPTDA